MGLKRKSLKLNRRAIFWIPRSRLQYFTAPSTPAARSLPHKIYSMNPKPEVFDVPESVDCLAESRARYCGSLQLRGFELGQESRSQSETRQSITLFRGKLNLPHSCQHFCFIDTKKWREATLNVKIHLRMRHRATIAAKPMKPCPLSRVGEAGPPFPSGSALSPPIKVLLVEGEGSRLKKKRGAFFPHLWARKTHMFSLSVFSSAARVNSCSQSPLYVGALCICQRRKLPCTWKQQYPLTANPPGTLAFLTLGIRIAHLKKMYETWRKIINFDLLWVYLCNKQDGDKTPWLTLLIKWIKFQLFSLYKICMFIKRQHLIKHFNIYALCKMKRSIYLLQTFWCILVPCWSLSTEPLRGR